MTLNRSIPLILALAIFPTAPWAQAQDAAQGNDGPGGFAYRYATERLRSSVVEIAPLLSRIPDAIFERYRVSRTDIVEAVNDETIQERPARRRTRAGRPLELDYSPATLPCRIIVLEPFFQLYESRRAEPSADLNREIQTKLLHEAAHCSGAGEATASQFALEAMSALFQPIPAPPPPTLPAPPSPLQQLREGLYDAPPGYCGYRITRIENSEIQHPDVYQFGLLLSGTVNPADGKPCADSRLFRCFAMNADDRILYVWEQAFAWGRSSIEILNSTTFLMRYRGREFIHRWSP